MPGAPDPRTSWPGTKNAQSHRVWLSEPVHELLPDVLAAPREHGRMQRDMRDICTRLGVGEKVTPHDLRRTFCSKVTALGFGREAMNRVTNHKEGGIADVYDRHRYAEENKKIMETVARHLDDDRRMVVPPTSSLSDADGLILLSKRNLSGQTKASGLNLAGCRLEGHWVLLLRCSRP